MAEHRRGRDAVRLHPKVDELLVLDAFNRARKQAMASFISALDILGNTDSPNDEQDTNPPVRRFTRCFAPSANGERRSWLWVYFGEVPNQNYKYLIVGMHRVVGDPVGGKPPEPPQAAWDVARSRLLGQ